MFELLLLIFFVIQIIESSVSIPRGYRSEDSIAWYHIENHTIYKLFSRAQDDGTDYPAVGTTAWSAPFPRSSPSINDLPGEWIAALDNALAAKKIPDIPRATNTPQTNPVYPRGVNPLDKDVCSATYKCRNVDDIWDGPNGTFGISFDDGPQPATPKLLRFLSDNREKATHFMIGVNILAYPQQFLATLGNNNDIAIHTWTHPYMTTLSNLEIVGQLGWTMELIRRSTGGRIPKFWRPPYGDVDNRVRAIAKEVFGLRTVIWNQDTADWTLATGGITRQEIVRHMEQWITGSKYPGLVVLEHETSEGAVDTFIAAYPLIKSNRWNTRSLVQLLDNGDAYQNAHGSDSNDVVPTDIIVDKTDEISTIVTSTSSVSTSWCVMTFLSTITIFQSRSLLF
ncbi:hypothetical protein BDQ17DRAFT_1301332 [Cyathus striatus]|nr:hypothetical protein BDQ17DRAFT_1301332 [Cyathus striatus]